MSNWNYDVEACPKSYFVDVEKEYTTKGKTEIRTFKEVKNIKVILATRSGQVVTTSRWMPDENRWLGLAHGEQPLCWQIYPTHPNLAE